MFKNNWSKSLKKISLGKGNDPFKMEITPYRDWRILVIIFSVGLVGSLGFNIYMSIEINSDNFFKVAPKSSTGVAINKIGLTKILKEFSDKEAVFEKTRTEGVAVFDPSL